MKIKKGKIIASVLLLIFCLLIVIYIVRALPIISHYAAKVSCSCMFNSQRSLVDVERNELSTFPFWLATVKADTSKKIVTASIGGFFNARAIYRQGLGCTLVHPASKVPAPVQGFQPLKFLNNPDSIDWPLGNANAYQTFSNINSNTLDSAFRYAFLKNKEGSMRFGTRAVVVLYKGKIVREAYAPGFAANTMQSSWSLTKSISNALVGILVGSGKVSLSADSLFTEWLTDDRRLITLNNLLQANSGLAWKEEYSRPGPATNMLFMQNDVAGYVKQFKVEDKPGKTFRYSSGTTNLISHKIQLLTGARYGNFAHKELFARIGMYNTILEPDASGTYVMSSYCYASAHDWARFGLLYLNDGMVNNKRVLPAGWVTYTRTPAPGATMGEYGAQFWLNAGQAGNAANRTYQSVPTDCYYASGYEGQFVWIIPSKQLVIVKLALENEDELDEDKFLSTVVNSIE